CSRSCRSSPTTIRARRCSREAGDDVLAGLVTLARRHPAERGLALRHAHRRRRTVGPPGSVAQRRHLRRCLRVLRHPRLRGTQAARDVGLRSGRGGHGAHVAGRARAGRGGRAVMDDRPRYMISIAAELVGMHPQTLRIYESKGLVSPKRTRGNTRLYSEADLERLRLIQRLTTELGLNLAGVEVVLRLEDELRRAHDRLELLERQRREEIQDLHRQYRRDLVLYRAPQPVPTRQNLGEQWTSTS